MRYSRAHTAENHTRILDAASRLFRQRGFQGVGVADLMKAAGLTHGGFYAHFRSKEDLIAAASEHALIEMDGRLDRAAASETDPLRAFLDMYLSTQHRDNPGAGCAVAALGCEVARLPPPIRSVFTAAMKRTADKLAAWFPGRRRKAAALHCLATLVGAIVLARAVDDRELSDEILQAAREGLGELTQTPGIR